ncbi:MAG: hypothetical protein KDJ27_18340 [Gammaproteobacteria bacterium]|nr:hypothetical protein [Gammaproteobacteria bacterium]MCB1925670.1 hypothetical protein [Gammaproteobacteria bacterium]
MNRRVLSWLPALLLAACASQPEPQTPALSEQQSLDRSARLAFDQAHYAQAATLYAAALEQALSEDRASAIIDARFNLALSKAYLGDYRSALEQVDQADAERLRRGLGADAQLQLLRAIIHYRAGSLDNADRALSPLLDDPALAPTTAARAHFLAGLIAADRGAADALRAHLSYLQTDPSNEVDRVELGARLAAVEGDTEGALRMLDRAIELRSQQGDYRGMVRCLASAGHIAEQQKSVHRAAAYFLRAGRSAAQRQEPQAPGWLRDAIRLGEQSADGALVVEAKSILDGVPGAQP